MPVKTLRRWRRYVAVDVRGFYGLEVQGSLAAIICDPEWSSGGVISSRACSTGGQEVRSSGGLSFSARCGLVAIRRGGLLRRPAARPARIDTRTEICSFARLVYRSEPGRARREAAPVESTGKPPDLLSSCSMPQVVEEIALFTSRRRYRCDVFLNTGGASGIAAPSCRGSDPPKCTPVPSLMTAWP